jgi:hypothetical protein
MSEPRGARYLEYANSVVDYNWRKNRADMAALGTLPIKKLLRNLRRVVVNYDQIAM